MKPVTNICPACGRPRSPAPSSSTQQQRKRAARALAGHLAFALNIPDARNLVFILGRGDEPGNHEALEHWVLDRLGHIECWPLPADEVHALINDLERDLRMLLADLSPGSFHV